MLVAEREPDLVLDALELRGCGDRLGQLPAVTRVAARRTSVERPGRDGGDEVLTQPLILRAVCRRRVLDMATPTVRRVVIDARAEQRPPSAAKAAAWMASCSQACQRSVRLVR